MMNFIRKNSFTFLLIGLMFFMFSLFSLFNNNKDESEFVMEIKIEQGDTLWHLAEKYNYDNIDTSKFISKIQETNNIEGSVIKAGDVLRIPVKQDTEMMLTMNE